MHEIFEAKQVTERFRKREFVVALEADSRYPQYVLFELTGDRCEALDDFRAGDEVRVEFTLRGREWKSPKGETKYFNSLNAWTLEAAGGRSDGFADEEPPLPEGPPPGFGDDVPF